MSTRQELPAKVQLTEIAGYCPLSGERPNAVAVARVGGYATERRGVSLGGTHEARNQG